MMVLRITDKTICTLFKLHRYYVRASQDEAPYIVEEAARLLGPLAPWWLDPDALHVLAQHTGEQVYAEYARTARSPAPLPGMSLITCRWESCEGPLPAGTGSLLRPAAVLPVRWMRSTENDPGLPRALLGLARRVVERMRVEGEPEYGLRWAFPRSSRVDASSLSMSPDSAFMSLAASLELSRCSDRAQPDLRIWATAAWDIENEELKAVDGVSEKIATMAQFGADAVFVPPQNYNEARAACRSCGLPVHIVKPLSLQSKLDVVMKPILAKLRLPPGPNASFEELCEYNRYLQRFDERARRHFYRDRILDHVIERCQATLPEELKRMSARGPLLVSVLSHNYDLIRLAYKAFCCRGVYLIDTLLGDARVRDEALSLFQRWGIAIVMHEQMHPRGFREACQCAQQIYDRAISIADGAPVIIDLTPGQKLMTLALEACRRDGACLVYLCHDWQDVAGVGAPEPGTERYEVVEAFEMMSREVRREVVGEW